MITMIINNNDIGNNKQIAAPQADITHLTEAHLEARLTEEACSEPRADAECSSTRSTRRHSVDTVSTYLSHESKDSLQVNLDTLDRHPEARRTNNFSEIKVPKWRPPQPDDESRTDAMDQRHQDVSRWRRLSPDDDDGSYGLQALNRNLTPIIASSQAVNPTM